MNATRPCLLVALPRSGMAPADLTTIGIGPQRRLVERAAALASPHYAAVGVFEPVTNEAVYLRGIAPSPAASTGAAGVFAKRYRLLVAAARP